MENIDENKEEKIINNKNGNIIDGIEKQKDNINNIEIEKKEEIKEEPKKKKYDFSIAKKIGNLVLLT